MQFGCNLTLNWKTGLFLVDRPKGDRLKHLQPVILANQLHLVRFNVTKMKIEDRRFPDLGNVQPSVEIAAPAKINLFLEVLGKRSDGFHEIENVMTTVNWFDRIRFIARLDDQIHLHQINPDPIHSGLPTDERNLIVRALVLLRKKFATDQLLGCDILLYKEIPLEAGLGGASSNAAAALLAGKMLWNLRISDVELYRLAAELGSDVPFFLRGGAAICRGRGERIESLPERGAIPIVIVKPPSGLSTRNVYSQVQLPREAVCSESLMAMLIEGRITRVGQELFNRLSETAMHLNEQIAEVSEMFTKTTSVGHQMSGSGSSYFGLFQSARAARQAARQLANRLPQAKIFAGQTLGSAKPGLSIIV